MKKQKDRNFLEALLQNAEAVADALTDNEAVKAVPVIGTAFKIAKGLDDLRSRALAAKLSKFLQEPSLCSAHAIERMKAKLLDDPDEQAAIGEALFLTLDKVTDFKKPEFLAKLFYAYLDNVVSGADLRRMSHGVDLAFVDDLLQLLNSPQDLEPQHGLDWKQGLVGAGLTRPVSGQTYDDIGKTYFELTDVGREFMAAIEHVERETWRARQGEA